MASEASSELVLLSESWDLSGVASADSLDADLSGDDSTELEGSAKYFRETVLSKDIDNVVMQSEYFTRSEIIPADTLKSNIQLCKRKNITHIVTGITYGMSVYFDFRQERR